MWWYVSHADEFLCHISGLSAAGGGGDRMQQCISVLIIRLLLVKRVYLSESAWSGGN